MEPDRVMSADEQAIERLISSRAGYCVSFDGISVYKLDSACEEGQYVVSLETDRGEDERCFKTAARAAIFFETHRRRLKFGFDFEGNADRD